MSDLEQITEKSKREESIGKKVARTLLTYALSSVLAVASVFYLSGSKKKEVVNPPIAKQLEQKVESYKDCKIVFSSDRDGNFEIYTMNHDGSDIKRLTKNPGSDQYPSWSPRRRLAFSSKRNGFDDIYVMNPDGSNKKKLTNGGNFFYPVWSPDGKKISFASAYRGSYKFHVINSDGTGQKQLTDFLCHDMYHCWSPSGKVTFVSIKEGNCEIYSIDPGEGNLERRTNNSLTDSRPSWSRDGRLAFVRGKGVYDIYVRNTDGSEHNLTDNKCYNMSPIWSPDGKKIAYMFKGKDDFELWVMKDDGTDKKKLAGDFEGVSTFAWSPGGRKIAFVGYKSGNSEIYSVGIDGSDLTNLTNNPSFDMFSSWSPFLAAGTVLAEEVKPKEVLNPLGVKAPSQQSLESVLRSSIVQERGHIYFNTDLIINYVDSYLNSNTSDNLEKEINKLEGDPILKHLLSITTKYLTVKKQIAAKDIEGLIEQLGDDSIACSFLYEEGVRENNWLMVKACEGIASLEGKEIPYLKEVITRKITSTKEDHQRNCAIYVLGLSKDPRALDILLELSTEEKNCWRRYNIIYALSLHGNSAIYKWMETELGEKGYIATLSKETELLEIQKIAKSDNRKARRQLYDCLLSLDIVSKEYAKRYLPVVREQLKEEKYPQCRGAIITYLGRNKDTKSINELKKILKEDSSSVKTCAVIYLLDMGIPEAIPEGIDILFNFKNISGARFDIAKRLVKVTGQDFGYRFPYVGKTDQLVEAAQKYKEWWGKNGDLILSDRYSSPKPNK